MKFSYFILIGTIAVMLSSSFIIMENLQPLGKEVFAQSDNSNKGFDNAKETHSSDTSIKNQNKNPAILRLDNEDSKVHPQISKILQHANPNAMAKILGSPMDGDKLYVYVYLDDKKIQNKALDIEISGQYENIIVSKLNLQQIQTLAKNDSVKKITLPDIAVPYPHGVSEGVSFSLADQMHTAGFNGTGVKVAIIDSGFSANNPHIMNNIAPSGTWVSSFCDDLECNNELGPTHGTAVAEIVVDMAPEVELYLYSIVFTTDFAMAIDDAIAKDVDIITASLGFPGEFGEHKFLRDGTSFSAKKVNEAQANQTIVTIAAGNSGEAHWSGFYTPNATRLGDNLERDLFDPDEGLICSIFLGPDEVCPDGQRMVYQSVMMFNSNAPNSSMQACLPINYARGELIDVSWSDFPETDQDYDVFIYDSTANFFLNSDAGGYVVENGDDPPRVSTNVISGPLQQDVCLIIAAASTNSTHLFHIDTDFRTDSIIDLPDFDPGRFGSISTPADATGSFTIGAVDFNNSTLTYTDDKIRPYSSLGPTDDGRTAEGAQGRLKPEICGPDGQQRVLKED
jgi:subtilisin family serine protease